MSEWLTRATEALRGEKEPEPQPFELDCDCVTNHGGFLRRRHQRIICRSCGAALFVLPADSYPVPSPPQPKKKRKRKRRKSAHRTADVAATQAAVAAGRALATRAASGVSEASAQVAARTSDAGRSLTQRIRAAGAALVRFWTPFRLVVLCIVLAVGGTVSLTMRSDSNEAAIASLIQSNEAARAALSKGDIAAAHEQLDLAVIALDQLDRHTDPLAREIRQLHRETSVMTELLNSSIFDVVYEAEEALVRREMDEFHRQFRLRYRDRWVVIEAPVARIGRSPEGGHYRINVPAAIGDYDRMVVISGRFPALDTLKFRDSQREVIFAGQLKSCELSPDRRSWVLRLEPPSVFLWANAENYGALGLTSSDPERAAAINRILATQSLANELHP